MTVNPQIGLGFGEFVAQVGHDAPRVKYVLASRGIKPLGRVGRYRVFSPDDVPFVRSACDRIEAERTGYRFVA